MNIETIFGSIVKTTVKDDSRTIKVKLPSGVTVNVKLVVCPKSLMIDHIREAAEKGVVITANVTVGPIAVLAFKAARSKEFALKFVSALLTGDESAMEALATVTV